MKTIMEIYGEHAETPHLEPKYLDELMLKPIAKRQMIRTEEGLLPGHVIMLWRIQFGSYRTDSPHHKYFYTTYGIDAQKELEWLIDEGYVTLEKAKEGLRHLPSTKLKVLLKDKNLKGLSKMKRADLDNAMLEAFSPAELENLVTVRAYLLLPKGQEILDNHPDIIDKHPQKKIYK